MNTTFKIALEEPPVCEKPESLNFITCTAALPLSSFLLLEQIKRTLLLESSMSSTYITRWICGNVEGGTYRNSFDPEESETEFLTTAQWPRLSWCLLVVIPFLWSWRNGNTAPYHPPPITFWPPTIFLLASPLQPHWSSLSKSGSVLPWGLCIWGSSSWYGVSMLQKKTHGFRKAQHFDHMIKAHENIHNIFPRVSFFFLLKYS